MNGLNNLAWGLTADQAAKCARCWHYRSDIGSHAGHPDVCGRCAGNLAGTGEIRVHA